MNSLDIFTTGGTIDKVYFDIGEENFRSRKATEKLGAVMNKKNSNGKLLSIMSLFFNMSL